ncbi:hypothetical protein [Paeniglutamicibacter kerguelensis]
MSLYSIIEAANDPELWAGWGRRGYGTIPVIYGMPVAGVVALVPAAGAFLGLFIHSGHVPLPSVNQQALAACWGATAAAAVPAVVLMLATGEEYKTAIVIGAGFVLVSSCIAFLVARQYLRYLSTHDEATIRVTRASSSSHLSFMIWSCIARAIVGRSWQAYRRGGSCGP